MKVLTRVDIHVESRDECKEPPPLQRIDTPPPVHAMTDDTDTAILDVTPETNTEYLQLLVEGTAIPGDSQAPFTKPHWYEEDKFLLGQKFAVKYMFGVMYAEMLSLIWLFLLKGGLDPLKFTNKSNSPYRAFTRYFSTVVRVKSWYEGDIWKCDTEAHHNLKVVRTMHDAVRYRMTSLPVEEVINKVALEGEGKTPLWTTLHKEVCEDFQTSCPMLRKNLTGPKCTYINQTDMAITQLGFMGLVLLFPKMFGIHHATDQEFDGFIHFWRTIGYCLGIEDRFNLCDGNLETVRQRSREIFDVHVIPSFTTASKEWIHMSRCMVEGISFYMPGATFEGVLAYLCRVLSINTPKLFSKLTFRQKFWYYYTMILFAIIVRIPGSLSLHNWLLNSTLKRVRVVSPEWKKEREERIYPYENQAPVGVVF